MDNFIILAEKLCSPITYKSENTKGLNSFVYVLILVINHVIKISINHTFYFN